MPNKEKNITPLQEIMNNIESGISGFGLPPLPPLSKLIPGPKEEEPEEQPEEVKKPKKILEVEEIVKHEKDIPSPTDTRRHTGGYRIYERKMTPLTKDLKKELMIRDVFARQGSPSEMKK